nr:mannosyltransferase [Millisia brevis]
MSGFGRISGRLVRYAGPICALALIARLVMTLLGPNARNWVDLHVYVDGAARLLSGDLYLYTYADHTPDFPLPFTYPPFAAVVFLPLHLLPFGVVAVAWQVATIAALFLVVRITLDELRVTDDRGLSTRLALLWTAVGMWTEPVRTSLDYGQVNVFLVLGALVAIRSGRWWVTGGLIGVMAGIKLVPAITGIYLLVVRRPGAAIASGVAFLGTIAVSWLIARDETTQYFTSIFGDADRIGPVGSVVNQSLRGTLSRFVGSDVGMGPLWLGAALVVVVLAVAAFAVLLRSGIPTPAHGGSAPGRGDAIGLLVVTQLVGLLLSPISWSHHWVWVIVLALWLVHGPQRHRPGARLLLGYWAVVAGIGVPWLLTYLQPSIWQIERPLWQAILGACFAVGALATLLWIALAGRRNRSATAAREDAGPAPGKLSSARRAPTSSRPPAAT